MRTRHRIIGAVVAALFLGTVTLGAVGWHSGYRAYVIHTGSMQPTLVPGDLIIDKPATSSLRPGQVITFRHSAGPDLVTHRITTVGATGIHTKGDGNSTPDVWTIPPSLVHGVETLRLPRLGYVAVYLRQPTGIASLVTILLGLVLLWGLFFPDERTESR